MQVVLSLSILLHAAAAAASGWNDYNVEIAPGFRIWRMNSFLVCLSGGPDDLLLVCPTEDPPTFGPVVEYAVTEDAIVTRNLGVRVDAKNSSLQEIDPTQELFFQVRRTDRHITGPLTLAQWERSGLPSLASVEWVEPRNPNFWLPILGTLLFVGFYAGGFGWPLAIPVLVALAAYAVVRIRARRAAAG